MISNHMAAIEIPNALVFEVVETMHGMKSASASARTKPAELSNRVEIQISEYLKTGEMARVNTETRKFISRA